MHVISKFCLKLVSRVIFGNTFFKFKYNYCIKRKQKKYYKVLWLVAHFIINQRWKKKNVFYGTSKEVFTQNILYVFCKDTSSWAKHRTNKTKLFQLTLNLITSSILACLPSLTQEWKKLGATLTPRASDVIPVWVRSACVAITRNVPKRRTSKCWENTGIVVMSL